MIKLKISIISISLLICPWLVKSYAAVFEEIGTSVRAMGMGNCFVAVQKDANTMFYNPAGLVKLNKKQFSLSYAQLAVGIGEESTGDNVVALAVPLGNSGIVVGGNVLMRSLSGIYFEDSYGISVAGLLFSNLSVGVNLKLLTISFRGYVLENNNFFKENGSVRTGTAVDIGIITKLPYGFLAGASIKNVNQPNLAFAADVEDKVPMTVRGGMSYQDIKSLGLIVADIVKDENGIEISAGIEKPVLNNRIKLRSGISCLWSGIASNASAYNVSVGAGISFKKMVIDYAFTFKVGDLTGYQNHRFGIGQEF